MVLTAFLLWLMVAVVKIFEVSGVNPGVVLDALLAVLEKISATTLGRNIFEFLY